MISPKLLSTNSFTFMSLESPNSCTSGFIKSRRSKYFYNQIMNNTFHFIISNEIFLGDFEVNLTPYYKEGVQKSLSLDLRNFALLKTRPSYIPTDMRKKGVIEFDLKITSNVKKYLLDSNDIRTELAPEMEKTSKDKQKEAANSNEKKD